MKEEDGKEGGLERDAKEKGGEETGHNPPPQQGHHKV